MLSGVIPRALTLSCVLPVQLHPTLVEVIQVAGARSLTCVGRHTVMTTSSDTHTHAHALVRSPQLQRVVKCTAGGGDWSLTERRHRRQHLQVCVYACVCVRVMCLRVWLVACLVLSEGFSTVADHGVAEPTASMQRESSDSTDSLGKTGGESDSLH